MAQNTGSPQSAGGRSVLGDYAPKLMELTDTVLFGDVRERPALRGSAPLRRSDGDREAARDHEAA
ncbi:hypothetical protein [Nonomuraea sp. NPDC049480]|uniref:hypothetical protein n=1 Tax=Nonomuraea sp. NPDC049480 TaxID=3364353 RepID=UPI0037A5A2EA